MNSNPSQNSNNSPKSKSKSIFRSLPDEDQQRIIDLCSRHTYDHVLEILAKPRPEGLQIQTSHSALCRFYCSWNKDAQKAKIIDQAASSLQYCRQAAHGSFHSGILTLLETHIFEALRTGSSVADLKNEFAALKDIHRSFLAEEKWRRESFSKADKELKEHQQNSQTNTHYDFVPVDDQGQPTEPPPFSPEEIAEFEQFDEDPAAANRKRYTDVDETIACHGVNAATKHAVELGIPLTCMSERFRKHRDSLRARGLTALQGAAEARLAQLRKSATASVDSHPSSSDSISGSTLSQPDSSTSNHQKTPANPHNPPESASKNSTPSQPIKPIPPNSESPKVETDRRHTGKAASLRSRHF